MLKLLLIPIAIYIFIAMLYIVVSFTQVLAWLFGGMIALIIIAFLINKLKHA